MKRVTGTDEWDAITRRCTEDLLVYLALGRFRRRPPISALPLGLQRDIRAFFGSYSNACRLADDLLFRAGERRGRRRSLPAVGRRQAAAERALRPSHRARSTRPAAARLRGMRPGLPGRDRRGQPDQAAPPVRQGLVPRLSRFRDRPAPGPAAQRQALAPHPRDRLLRLHRQREPADPASQGDVSGGRSSAPCQVRPADPARGEARPAGRHGDDRDARRLEGTVERGGALRFAGIGLVRS